MERYFTIGDFNTWYDWSLVLTAKDVTPPEPKENYVNLDGMNGTLDLSESLTGEVTYEDRKISATFWTDKGTREDRVKLIRDIIAAVHGRKLRIVEPDDPDHFFKGRVKVKSYNNILPYAEIKVEITCEPWRYAIEESTRTVEINGDPVDIVIRNNGVKTLSPTIVVSGSITIILGDDETTLADGSYRLTAVKLRQGINVLKVSGSGSASIIYREADL